ncbi:MAG: rhamnan synthesis F family protein [bacterium]
MTKKIALYIYEGGAQISERSLHMVRALQRNFDIVAAIVPAYAQSEATYGRLVRLTDKIIFSEGACPLPLGMKIGLQWVEQTHKGDIEELWVTNSSVYGPIGRVRDKLERAREGAGQIIAPYFHNLELDPRVDDAQPGEKIPYLDFTLFKRPVLEEELFWRYWETIQPSGNYWADYSNIVIPFFRQLREKGLSAGYYCDPDSLETADPRLSEVHKVVQSAPVISRGVFDLEPELHDLQSIYGRDALAEVKHQSPEVYGHIWKDLLASQPMREVNAKFDQIEIIPERRLHARKNRWKFGQVAVFIHAFYAKMMPEFWQLIEKLPLNFDLFITTATKDNRSMILKFLDEKGFPKRRTEVRVVEVNRGRDMSSLFITFKDIVLSGDYEVCLRLHSKRTPQVARQVGESFKDHLFENLVYNRAYVANLYDLLEADPTIGLVIPPTIHIGFGTLGHSWFNNREGVQQIAADMGITIPMDEFTPVAPYGTMYWFRADALKLMFEWPWQWDQYNEEPNHIDGGLAHLQERLIGYTAQHEGYRVLTIMNRFAAARNYSKLEYKAQLLAGHLPTANIYEQRRLLEQRASKKKFLFFDQFQLHNVYQKAEQFYANQVLARPRVKRIIQPIARQVGRVWRAII